MTKLIVARGLPGSGKTTWTRKWVEEDRANRARVNRDDLRIMVDEGVFVKGVTEPRIMIARNAQISALLDQGIDVVSDDTNLVSRVVRDLAQLAASAGADLEVKDFTDVPLEVCIERDAARSGRSHVGETVIREMHTRYLRGRKLPLPVPEIKDEEIKPDPYVALPDVPKAILVDIDGTVALKGDRDIYDESRVLRDLPNVPIVTLVQAMSAAGYEIIFMSGRTNGCRQHTMEWLREHVGVPFQLHMRSIGDRRRDAVVKKELFDKHVRYHYNVLLVLDDRDQVVKLWRNTLGMTCSQVGEGNF